MLLQIIDNVLKIILKYTLRSLTIKQKIPDILQYLESNLSK